MLGTGMVLGGILPMVLVGKTSPRGDGEAGGDGASPAEETAPEEGAQGDGSRGPPA